MVTGVPFSEGSRFLRGHVSHFDSELVLRLRLDLIWHMLTTGEVFADLGADYFTSRLPNA